MAGGRGDKREHGAKKGGGGKAGKGRGSAGGRGEKRDSGAGASNANSVNFTSPPPPAYKVENYSVLNLDNPETSHKSWRATQLRYRLWCFTNTDKRYMFGHKERQSCIMPEKGHFLIYVHHRGEWMCLVIEGPTGYLTGYITRSSTSKKKIRENQTKYAAGLPQKDMKSKLPMYIECAEMLPWRGSYFYAAECLMGDLGLQNSFTVMYKHIEGTQIYEDSEVQKAGETFQLHLPEAGRSNKIFQKIDNNYIGGSSNLGRTLLSKARNWATRKTRAFGIMVDLTPSIWDLKRHGKSREPQPKSVNEKAFGPEVEVELQIIEDIRLYYRQDKEPRFFRLQDLPVHLGSHGPVNNKLNNLLEPDTQDVAHSMFLIEPFLKFKRENTNQESEKSKISQSMDNRVSHAVPVQPALLNKVQGSAQVMSQQNQAEQSHGWAGLRNPGNTCFANSVLQFLHCILDLKSAIIRFSKAMSNESVADQAFWDLTDAMRDVFMLLDDSPEVVCPNEFLKKLEQRHPMYKQRDPSNESLRRQQDAGECLTHLIEILTETLSTEDREPGNIIRSLFGLDLLKRGEDGEEAKTVSYTYLDCLIPDDVNVLLKGLQLALCAHNSSINRLPRYLTFHLERVKLDETGQSVKNSSELAYPLEFDAYNLCSDEMKHELEANRKSTSTNVEDSRNRDIDKADSSKEKLTGFYDLIALITHEGQDTNSGHYIALIKQDENKWTQFNDDTTSILKNEEVLQFPGGGDGQMAYIFLYKARVGREGSV